ncbi:ubiquitin carboxyl-terminal hydrolase 24 [Phalaenopsis equestris]|uniref:ubiquitin carboxyl-terminal hydrolase 24 n=1 Tax=Phalaenopsis equestris TaxID=78828 RepID=UPI0009E4E00B|nr:ubiquitin carboxyl-terminal hydrolase 24 [Phalaenopsis equestris]
MRQGCSKEMQMIAPPFELLGLQFGSLDINALSSVKGFESVFKQNASTVAKDFPTATLSEKKGKDEPATDQVTKQSVELKPNTTANGCVPICGEEVVDERIHKGMNSPKFLEEDACSRNPPCPTVQANGLEMLKNGNDFLSKAAVVKNAGNVQESSNHAPLFRGLLPRGLINLGNLCFLNSTLQALLSCSPFVQLLLDLKTRSIPKAGYPTLHAFVDLISEFCLPNASNLKNGREAIEGGRPFSPIMFETVLKNFTPDFQSSMSARPRQEDAQEFLGFVMDQMHDELLRLGGNLSGSNGKNLSLTAASDDDGWETIGPKNKSAITRTQSLIPSELSAIFGGQLRSVVKARGNKASATVQPFLLLHLDILPEAIHTIEDALRFFSAPATLEGYRASSGKAGLVNASKSVKIQTLSKIMILHLMRFSYGTRGSSKLNKPIHFPLELVMGRDLLVTPSTEGRKFELVATITHHGREHSKGHYTADCRYSNGRWLRYDDSSVTSIGINKVLHDQAYVLFYKQV